MTYKYIIKYWSIIWENKSLKTMTFPESSMANYLKGKKKTTWFQLLHYADTRERFWKKKKIRKKKIQTQNEVFTDVTLLGFPLYLTGWAGKQPIFVPQAKLLEAIFNSTVMISTFISLSKPTTITKKKKKERERRQSHITGNSRL